MNNTSIAGRLTQNPELKEFEDGKKVANVTLAVGRSYKNSEGVYETDFIDCEVWGGQAESLTEYCKKGDLIGIKGTIKVDSYEAEDGSKRKVTKVVANSRDGVKFLSTAKEVSSDKIKEDSDDFDME